MIVHALVAAEFLMSGALIGLTALIGRDLWRIREEMTPGARRYMGRMTAFLFALSWWWFISRLALLGFTPRRVQMGLDIGRSVAVAFQFWATWGLIRFLRHRRKR